MDKCTIFRNLVHLKKYNENQKSNFKQTVYVTEHLPEALLKQKKLLMPQFKLARLNKQKAYWRVENGD